jgi:hypothetical protein
MEVMALELSKDLVNDVFSHAQSELTDLIREKASAYG